MLLNKDEKLIIDSIIKSLVIKVSEHINNDIHNGLLSGLAGHLLFLYKATQYDSKLVDDTLLLIKLEQLQEQLGEQSFELSNGLAGQAWLLEYINQCNIDSSDYDFEIMSSVDFIFLEQLNHGSSFSEEIEMVLGICGLSPYTARRAKYTNQLSLYRKIVSDLASKAEYFDNGHITWSQPRGSVYRFDILNEEFSEYNLGLAHGVPGVISSLLPAINIPELKEKVTSLLIGSCDWLLDHQNLSSAGESCFSSCVGGDFNSRLGWCYGDLTIALTLARVGIALDKKIYVQRALEIALHSTNRDAFSAHINDAGLCHGYFGLVTIFQIFNKLIPHSKLQQASYDWLNYGLKEYRKKGLKSLYANKGTEEGYVEDFSFLMGYSGIGLVLISVLADDIDWADCLLMA